MTNISTLGQALRQIENLGRQQEQFGQLSTQLATGKRSQTYSGLGTDALTSVRSRTSLSSVEVYINNITRADNTLSLTLVALEEFQEQSAEFSNTVINFSRQGDHQLGDLVRYDDPATSEVETTVVGNTSAEIDTDFAAVIDHATNLYSFLGDLLNTQEGERYLFAGADASTRPYTDTGTLDATISTLITDWKNGAITTEELIDDIFDGEATAGNPDAITDAAIGYSTSLSGGTSGDVFVRADDNAEFKYTTRANETALRDVLVTLAVLQNENLPPVVDVYEDGNFPATPDVKGAPGADASEQQGNFYQLFDAITRRVSTAIDDLDKTRFRLETVRVQMNETQESHVNEQQLLLNTISTVEDVDTNEVAVRLTTLQTQLEASYSVTALTQRLSLVNFI